MDDPATNSRLPSPNPSDPPQSQTSGERVNPYVGPRSLREGEPIFGRDRELRELLNRLIADRLVLLYSPSGAGKSSLVQAGLVPRMRQEKFKVLPTVRVGLEPPAELSGERPSQFNRYSFSALLSLEQDNHSELLPPPAESVEERQSTRTETGPEHSTVEQQDIYFKLARLTLKDYLAQRPRQPDEPYSRLLVFDQFEDILTQDPLDRDGKLAFFNQVGEALLDHDLWALFVIREDFLAGLDPYLPLIPTYLRSTFRLDLLEKEPALLAIQKPLEDQRIEFQDAAASKLVDDLRRVWVQQPDGSQREEPGLYVEPVQLQVVCRRLYRELGLDRDLSKSAITESDVSSLGDVNKSLGEYYSGEVGEIALRSGIPERAIREWFAECLITENLLRGQVLMGEGASGGLDNNVIRLLEDAHLLRAENRRNSTWFELAHDRLVRPILEDNQTWAEAHLQDFQRLAAEWRRKDRPSSLLLRGRDLLKAEEWAQTHPSEVTPVDWELVDASRERRARHLSVAQRKAADWEQKSRPEELLLNQTDLAQAETWLLEHADEATPLEAEYIAASREAAENEARQRRERELAFKYERQRTRLLLAFAGVVFLALLAVSYFAVQFYGQAGKNAAAAARNAEQRDINATQAELNSGTAVAVAAENDRNQRQAATLESANATSAWIANAQRATAVALAGEAQEQFQARSTADYNASLAQAGRLASLAEASINVDEPLSALLSIAAYRAFPKSWEGRTGLFTVVQQIPGYFSRSDADSISTELEIARAMAFSPDGKFLAWGGSEGKVMVWNVEEKALVYEKAVSPGYMVDTLVFSPVDNNLLVSGSADGYLSIWDLSTGDVDRQDVAYSRADGFNFRIGQFLSLALSPNGKSLAVSGDNGNVMIWDMEQRKLNKFVDLQNRLVSMLDWSPSGDRLAGVSGRVVYIWDASGELADRLTSNEPRMLALDWSPDGEWLAYPGGASENSDGSSSIVLYNTRTQKPVEISPASSHDVKMLAFDQDSRMLVVLSQGYYPEGDIDLYDVSQAGTSGSVTQLGDYLHYFSYSDVRGLAFTLQGPNRLAYIDHSYYGYEVTIVELGLIRPVNAELAGASPNRFVPVQPNPDLDPVSGLLAIGYGPEMEIHALTQQGKVILLSSIESDTSSTFQGDDVLTSAIGQGNLVATGDESGIVRLRDFGTRADLWETESQAPVFSLALSPSGESVAVGWCRTCGLPASSIGLFDVGSNQPPFLLTSSYEFTSLAFSWDGGMLAGGSTEGRIQLWDTQLQKPAGLEIVWDQGTEEIPQWWDPVGPITSLAFSQDRTTLASGDNRGRMALWDIERRRQIGWTIQVARAPITGLLFAPDGLSLVAAAQDGSIQRWDLDPEAWIVRLCQLAGRDFSQEELQLYFAGQRAISICTEILKPASTPVP